MLRVSDTAAVGRRVVGMLRPGQREELGFAAGRPDGCPENIGRTVAIRAKEESPPVRVPEGRPVVARIERHPDRDAARKLVQPDVGGPGLRVHDMHGHRPPVGGEPNGSHGGRGADGPELLPASAEPGHLRVPRTRLVGHAPRLGRREAGVCGPVEVVDPAGQRHGVAAKAKLLRIERLGQEGSLPYVEERPRPHVLRARLDCAYQPDRLLRVERTDPKLALPW